MGAPASFGPFTPGAQKDYFATTAANVISTAGDATLSVADPSATATGHLVNGAFSLPEALQAAGSTSGTYAPVGGSASPTTLKTYAAPVSNDGVTVSFKQPVKANDALRTGYVREDADLHPVDDESLDQAAAASSLAAALCGTQSASCPNWTRRAWPSPTAVISASSASSGSAGYLSSAMICATSPVVRPSGNASRTSAASSAGARRARLRVEVGDHRVVDLEGLEAAGLERQAAVGELDARRGEAHAAVRVGGLALELGRAALGGAGLVAVLLEDLLGLRVCGGGDDRVGIDAGDPGDRLAQFS